MNLEGIISQTRFYIYIDRDGTLRLINLSK